MCCRQGGPAARPGHLDRKELEAVLVVGAHQWSRERTGRAPPFGVFEAHNRELPVGVAERRRLTCRVGGAAEEAFFIVQCRNG